MPTYEYACTACNHRFELVQKFSDAPITDCPLCEGGVRKVYFAAGVVFKGSGWYINDSRPTPPSEAGSSVAATPGAEAASTPPTTTPAAPAPKPETPVSPTPSATVASTPSA
jgi:putative FmdB family regulatory protein